MSQWTTCIDAANGYHTVWFLPRSENILGRCVALLIPECELQNVYLIDGEPRAIINRPEHNKSIRYWLRFACTIATKEDCSLGIMCNTQEEAEHAAALAARRLPHHRRMPLERMATAKTRTSKGLC
jgi:hypothetical protein